MNGNVREGKVVCVTGAFGYKASWLVKFLLLRGCTVKGTVRDQVNPQTEIIDPAVKRTLNVLNPDICRDIKRWYSLGKTLAEEAAWKFAKENGIDLVALNPAFVIGPLLQPLLNESSAYI
ncbi:hypothetical protein K1719_041130 [Acacia pycnantha]|nr:hypothetical protein K1719_041130 [Acacia pycnantha]